MAFLDGGEEGESRLKVIKKNIYFTDSTWNIKRQHAATVCHQAASPFGFAFTCLHWQEAAPVCEQIDTHEHRGKETTTEMASKGVTLL